MGYTKLILPGSYDFGVPSLEIIKTASSGLRGHDLGMFIKRAGHKMADAMRNLSFASGEIPVHLIAIGATEFYGPNRNGDGFKEACCKKYHDTFVKFARWYRNHQNKDQSKSYGIIKYSAYNDIMHRLELIVALNGTKEAALRNGGLVADKEIEDLENGKDIGVSMACKVAYDVCSGCGNRARTKDEYCTEDNCPYGGCKTNLCKVAEDGHILHVDNPHPTWFDISKVWRPADRIAYVFGELQKAASAGTPVLSSAELAEKMGVTAPFELELAGITNRHVKEQLKLAHELAEIERDLLSGALCKEAAALPPVNTSLADIDTIVADVTNKPHVLKALADEKIAMSLTDFIQFVSCRTRTNAEKVANEVRPYLHGLFIDMCNNAEDLKRDLAYNEFCVPSTPVRGLIKMWAEKQAATASMNPESVQRLAWKHAIHDQKPEIKTGTRTFVKSAAHYELARAYNLYKVAFLYSCKDKDLDQQFPLTKSLVVRQNYIS